MRENCTSGSVAGAPGTGVPTPEYFAIHDKIQTLKESPNRCPMAFESRFYSYEIRNLIFGSYRVLFRVKEQEQTVQILHVTHGARERTPL